MSNHDLDRRLRDAGRAPVPEPRPIFADALEHRLRAGVPLAPAPVPVRRPGRRWVPVGALATAAVVVVALALGSRLQPEEQLRVASASDAVVVFPGGEEEPAVPGLVVPDGSVIRTGDQGRVVAGKVKIGPNREAVVKKGTVRQTKPPRPEAPGVTPPPDGGPGEEPPLASPRKEPPSDPPAKEPAAAAPTSSSTTNTTATTGPKPIEEVRELKLEAKFRDTTVQLTWSPYEGPGFAGYVVLRSDAPAEPVYPPDRNTTVVGRVKATSFTNYKVENPGGRRYRVVAVNDKGEVLARSRAVTPQASANATTADTAG
jgi:hypothetical protein